MLHVESNKHNDGGDMSSEPKRQERLEKIIINQQLIIADLKSKNSCLEKVIRDRHQTRAVPVSFFDRLKQCIKILFGQQL
jgi:hypothetical protein